MSKSSDEFGPFCPKKCDKGSGRNLTGIHIGNPGPISLSSGPANVESAIRKLKFPQGQAWSKSSTK